MWKGEIMTLNELKQDIQRPSRPEKSELSKMLREEERIGEHLDRGTAYPVFTPYNQEKAAGQLQQFL
jgi:hypothetical protein